MMMNEGPGASGERISPTTQMQESSTSRVGEVPVSDGVLRQELLDNMTTSLSDMRKACHLTDVVFECEDKRFPAHKVVLCAASPYCRILFTGSKQTTCKVGFSKIKAEAIEMLLDYMYTGNLGNVEDNVDLCRSVLAGAYLLQLSSVTRYCWKTLAKRLSVPNFLDLWNLAEMYKNTDMVNYVILFLASNFKPAIKSSQFVHLTLTQLKTLLSHPIVQSNPDIAAEAVLTWVKHDADERGSELENLFSILPMHNISGEAIATLQTDELVSKSVPLLKSFLNVTTTRLNNPAAEVELVCFGRTDETSIVAVYEHKFQAWKSERALPFKLTRGTAVVYFEGNLYFFGGGDIPKQAQKTVLKYNHQSNRVLGVNNLETAKVNMGVVVMDRKIYVIGGVLKRGTKLNTADRYDPDNNSWQPLTPTHEAHNFPKVATILDHLLILGSFEVGTMERYDQTANQWTIVNTTPFENTLDWPRMTLCLHKVYVITNEHSRDFLTYDSISNQWESIPLNFEMDKITGIWSLCTAQKDIPFIFVRDGEQALHQYDTTKNAWATLALPVPSPWNWWHTIITH